MVYHPNGSLIHQQSTLRLMEVDLVSSFVLTGAENKEVSEETTTGAFFAFSTTQSRARRDIIHTVPTVSNLSLDERVGRRSKP